MHCLKEKQPCVYCMTCTNLYERNFQKYKIELKTQILLKISRPPNASPAFLLLQSLLQVKDSRWDLLHTLPFHSV